MTFPVNSTAPRPVGQTQQGGSVTAKVNQRVAHAAASGARRSSQFKQFMGSARLLMHRGLNFLAPGNIRADSKCRVSESMTRREVDQMLAALSTQSGKNVVRNRLDVQQVLVGLESTMRPMTSRGRKYDVVLVDAIRWAANNMKPDQLDKTLARIGEINVAPNESARLTLVQNELARVRQSIPDLPTI